MPLACTTRRDAQTRRVRMHKQGMAKRTYLLRNVMAARGCDKKRDSQTPKYQGTSRTQFLLIFVTAQPQHKYLSKSTQL
jgi:hypothetical protein